MGVDAARLSAIWEEDNENGNQIASKEAQATVESLD